MKMWPSDMLLTEKMVEDEDVDMATAPTTSPAPRKTHFLKELCAAKMAAFMPFHSTLQSECLTMSMETRGQFCGLVLTILHREI